MYTSLYCKFGMIVTWAIASVSLSLWYTLILFICFISMSIYGLWFLYLAVVGESTIMIVIAIQRYKN